MKKIEPTYAELRKAGVSGISSQHLGIETCASTIWNGCKDLWSTSSSLHFFLTEREIQELLTHPFPVRYYGTASYIVGMYIKHSTNMSPLIHYPLK